MFDQLKTNAHPESIISSFPEITSASRSRVGDIWITEALSNGNTREINVHPFYEKDDQYQPYVRMVVREKNPNAAEDDSDIRTEITLNHDTGKVEIEVFNAPDPENIQIDIPAVLTATSHGLQLLADANKYTGTPSDITRNLYWSRKVSDEMKVDSVEHDETLVPVAVADVLHEHTYTTMPESLFLGFATTAIDDVLSHVIDLSK